MATYEYFQDKIPSGRKRGNFKDDLWKAMTDLNKQSWDEGLTWEDANKQAFNDIQEKYDITLDAELIKRHAFDSDFGWYINDWVAHEYIYQPVW